MKTIRAKVVGDLVGGQLLLAVVVVVVVVIAVVAVVLAMRRRQQRLWDAVACCSFLLDVCLAHSYALFLSAPFAADSPSVVACAAVFFGRRFP